jgi:citrate synthase
MAMRAELGEDNITHDAIRDYLWRTLKGGQVVPG